MAQFLMTDSRGETRRFDLVTDFEAWGLEALAYRNRSILTDAADSDEWTIRITPQAAREVLAMTASGTVSGYAVMTPLTEVQPFDEDDETFFTEINPGEEDDIDDDGEYHLLVNHYWRA